MPVQQLFSIFWIKVNASCETTPKRHGFLMIRLAAFQASGEARMKHRLAGTVNPPEAD
jgi:hypothetical protein